MRKILYYLSFLLAWASCAPLLPGLELSPRDYRMTGISPSIPLPYVLVPAPADAGPEQVLRLLDAGEGIPLGPEFTTTHGLCAAPVWLAGRLAYAGSGITEWMIEVGNPDLDHVEAWIRTPRVKAISRTRHMESGLMVPLRLRPVADGHILFPVTVAPTGQTVFLLKVTSGGSVHTRLTLHPSVSRYFRDDPGQLIAWAVTGALLMLGLICLLLYSLVRDPDLLRCLLSCVAFTASGLVVALVPSAPVLTEFPWLVRYGPGTLFLAGQILHLCQDTGHFHPARGTGHKAALVLLGLMTAAQGIFLTGVALSGQFALVALAFLSLRGIYLRHDSVEAGSSLDSALDMASRGMILAGTLMTGLDQTGVSFWFIPWEILVILSTGLMIATFLCLGFRLFLRVRSHLVHQTDLEEQDRISRAFISGMSHEMRSPLNGILGYAQHLDSGLDRSQLNEYRRRIEEETHILLQKVDRVLDVMRCEAGTMELTPVRFSPAVMLRQLQGEWTPSAQRKGLALELRADGALNTLVDGDRTRLAQVLSLLLDNGIKFTATGQVVLEGTVEKIDGAGLSCCFSVRDSGPGMAPERMEEVFRTGPSKLFHFHNTAGTPYHEGMGVGLCLTRRICRLLGADFRMESVCGTGCSARVRIRLPHGDHATESRETGLPPVVAPRTPAPPRPRMLQSARGPTRILVVDDLPVNRQVMILHLTRAGMIIDEAETGEAALEALERGTYDLVFMDIYMPGMGGIEATRHIRRKWSASMLPVIGITASTEEDDLRECIASGMNCFLLKPVTRDTLLGILGSFVENPA